MNFNLLEKTMAAAAGGSTQWLVMIGYIAIIGLALYFLMIRPQKKKQKAEENMRNNVQIGDEIITIGGFYGRVISIKEDALTIESPVDRSKQNIAKWAVQTNLTVHEEPAADKKAVKAKSDKADKAKKEDKAN